MGLASGHLFQSTQKNKEGQIEKSQRMMIAALNPSPRRSLELFAAHPEYRFAGVCLVRVYWGVETTSIPIQSTFQAAIHNLKHEADQGYTGLPSTETGRWPRATMFDQEARSPSVKIAASATIFPPALLIIKRIP